MTQQAKDIVATPYDERIALFEARSPDVDSARYRILKTMLDKREATWRAMRLG